ncbi:hypothetical protein F4818DRAFT_240997 [Hypoxylon cercidicola]|nr:hypothetical protein F4818DRAFT_240997 [Hypoxylon cercidicola]
MYNDFLSRTYCSLSRKLQVRSSTVVICKGMYCFFRLFSVGPNITYVLCIAFALLSSRGEAISIFLGRRKRHPPPPTFRGHDGVSTSFPIFLIFSLPTLPRQPITSVGVCPTPIDRGPSHARLSPVSRWLPKFSEKVQKNDKEVNSSPVEAFPSFWANIVIKRFLYYIIC